MPYSVFRLAKLHAHFPGIRVCAQTAHDGAQTTRDDSSWYVLGSVAYRCAGSEKASWWGGRSRPCRGTSVGRCLCCIFSLGLV